MKIHGWRTHSCVPRSHSCERQSRIMPGSKRSHECERSTQECVRHIGTEGQNG
jgi:hypothetical protein